MSKGGKSQEELGAIKKSSRIARSHTRSHQPRDAGREEQSPEDFLRESVRSYSSPTLTTVSQEASALPEGSRTNKTTLEEGPQTVNELDRMMEMLTIMREEMKESLQQVQIERRGTDELVRKQGEAISELQQMIMLVPPDTSAWDFTDTRLSSQIQPPRTNCVTLTTITTTTTTNSHSRMSCMEEPPSRQRTSDEFGQRFHHTEIPVDRFPPRQELRDEEFSHPACRATEDRKGSPFELPSYWGRPTATFPPRGNNTKLYKLASMLHLKYPRKDLTAQQFVRLVEIVCRQEYVSEAEIVHTLNFLLKGRALRWYELVQSQVNNWEDFKEKFLKQFGGQTTDLEISVKLASRRQSTGESNDDFILGNLDLVKKMKCPPSEGELVLQTIRGMKTSMQPLLLSRMPDTMEKLLVLATAWQDWGEISKPPETRSRAVNTVDTEKTTECPEEVQSGDESHQEENEDTLCRMKTKPKKKFFSGKSNRTTPSNSSKAQSLLRRLMK